jgi:hypothetical protein
MTAKADFPFFGIDIPHFPFALPFHPSSESILRREVRPSSPRLCGKEGAGASEEKSARTTGAFSRRYALFIYGMIGIHPEERLV